MDEDERRHWDCTPVEDEDWNWDSKPVVGSEREKEGSEGREPGYGGNTEGVIGEHQQRPGMGGKVKNTLAHVTAKLMGQKGEQERASNFPGAKFNEDPEMYVGPLA
ncbi:hypothetical protein R1sor_014856 [Riccia sorocarpa]|uniref:Uncharacterized protein n=1 Tax=Riccia sorocarpa TaxID=122646 RepID=A0ABD3HAK6_9MARC